jgi:hypothetical protein
MRPNKKYIYLQRKLFKIVDYTKEKSNCINCYFFPDNKSCPTDKHGVPVCWNTESYFVELPGIKVLLKELS